MAGEKKIILTKINPCKKNHGGEHKMAPQNQRSVRHRTSLHGSSAVFTPGSAHARRSVLASSRYRKPANIASSYLYRY